MSSSLIGNSAFKTPKGYRPYSMPTMTPESMNLWKDLIQRSGGGAISGTDLLNRIASGDESAFEMLEKPAYSAFNRLSGDIASKFSGAGMGARQSSGFRSAMTGEAGNLAEQLASNRLGLQLGASERLQDLFKSLLSQQPYQTALSEKSKKKSWLDKFLGIGAPIGGSILGGLFGGPTGAYLGGTIGSGIGSSFLD